MARIYYIGAAELPLRFPRCAPLLGWRYLYSWTIQSQSWLRSIWIERDLWSCQVFPGTPEHIFARPDLNGKALKMVEDFTLWIWKRWSKSSFLKTRSNLQENEHLRLLRANIYTVWEFFFCCLKLAHMDELKMAPAIKCLWQNYFWYQLLRTWQYVIELRTPNEGINQRYLKNWADVADKICCRHT